MSSRKAEKHNERKTTGKVSVNQLNFAITIIKIRSVQLLKFQKFPIHIKVRKCELPEVNGNLFKRRNTEKQGVRKQVSTEPYI